MGMYIINTLMDKEIKKSVRLLFFVFIVITPCPFVSFNVHKS